MTKGTNFNYYLLRETAYIETTVLWALRKHVPTTLTDFDSYIYIYIIQWLENKYGVSATTNEDNYGKWIRGGGK